MQNDTVDSSLNDITDYRKISTSFSPFLFIPDYWLC
ncbi:hypothetical protein ABIE12_003048 [Serratia sp. 509]